MQKKLFFSGLIMIGWLLATGYAFWWFQARDLRPFDLQAADIIEQKSLQTSLTQLLSSLQQDSADSAFLLHFWQPGCSCNRFNLSHVNEIAVKYQQQNFQLVTIIRPHPDYSNQQLKQMAEQQFASKVVIDSQHLLTGKSRIPAAPAAAVIDKNGELAYFGPYSDSTFCGLGGTAFVEKVADLLMMGESPSLLNTMVFGCFCDWDSNKLQQT
ncbi:MAG: DUF6436 domain-containing protein [Gammaproteobacteria bacterium]|nr:DUF6436 domain-containing protein [Gammaproteobacteria bacterium]